MNNNSSSHGMGHQTIYLVVAIVLAILTSVVLVWVLPEPDADGLPVAVKGDESRFTDGHTFTIKDKDGKLYKFEFNRESAKKDYHQIRISNGKRNAQQMAVVIAEAINAVTKDSVKAEAHDDAIFAIGHIYRILQTYDAYSSETKCKLFKEQCLIPKTEAEECHLQCRGNL